MQTKSNASGFLTDYGKVGLIFWHIKSIATKNLQETKNPKIAAGK